MKLMLLSRTCYLTSCSKRSGAQEYLKAKTSHYSSLWAASLSNLFDQDWLGVLTVLSGSLLLGVLLFSDFLWVEKTENHTFYFYSPSHVFQKKILAHPQIEEWCRWS